MRSIVLGVCWLIVFNVNAQIEGNYTKDGEAYSFRSDSTFDWIQTGDIITYGNGTYQIDKKTITLSFGKARLQPDIQLNESPVTNDDESIVEVRIMYSNGNPTSHSNVTLIQSKVSERTNTQGVVRFELPNPLTDDKIVMEVDGRKSAGIPIKLKGHHTLLGIVIDETAHYKEDQSETLSFKIKNKKIKVDGKTFRVY